MSDSEQTQLRDIVRQLQSVSKPPRRPPPVLPLYQGRILVGLFQRCRHLLAAVLTLDEARLIDGQEALVRTMYELLVTANWLLDDPARNFDVFQGATRRELSLLSEDFPETYGAHLHAFEEATKTSLGYVPDKVKLPPLQQRLVGPFKHGYGLFRDLSTRLHPTLLSIFTGMDEDPETGELVPTTAPPWLESDPHFFLKSAIGMMWVFTHLLLEKTFKLGRTAAIERVGERILPLIARSA